MTFITTIIKLMIKHIIITIIITRTLDADKHNKQFTHRLCTDITVMYTKRNVHVCMHNILMRHEC